MYPMKLVPPCKDYIWGGNRLREEYGKRSNADKIAESWELSCHKDGKSVVANGDFAGMTLEEVIEQTGTVMLGTNCRRFKYFPILIKLIDAKDNLSVQVHPDNEYAMRVEGEYGKTEMWYIVDCDEDAQLIYGLKDKISREEFASRIKDNTLLEVTNNVPVHKGDVFFIEAGTLHAIGKGILIAEIQQNSNTTYRVYDYGRVGADGKPRQLHVEKAVEVTELAPPKTREKSEPVQMDGFTQTKLASCEYFNVNKLSITEKAELNVTMASFCSILTLEGELKIGKVRLRKGDSCFIPAGFGRFTLEGSGEVIVTDII